MNNPKIVIVGAGSHFTLGLFGDFFRVNDLWGSDLVLMDVDNERLHIMERIVGRLVQKRGVDLRVSATSNLDEALENADFVIVTIRVGGLEALKEFIEVPLRFGVIEVVGDTVGPSGILKGMLEIPAVVNIAQKVKDVSPNVLMLNFTNPMTAICRAVRKSVGVQIVGFCHGFDQMRKLAANILSYPAEKIDVTAAGINHLTWTLNIKCDGESSYDGFLNSLFSEKHKNIMVRHPYLIGRELCKVFKRPPTLSDRHTSEFFHYLYSWIKDPIYGPILKKESGYIDYENKTLRKEVMEDEENRMGRLLRMADGSEETETTPSREYALDIVSAMENNREIKLSAANIPNNGTINGIAPDHIVEVPVKLNKHRLVPVEKFHLSRAITSLLNQHLEKYETLVEGVLERDKDLIVQAIALDPLTPSPEKAEKIFDLFVKKCSALGYLQF